MPGMLSLDALEDRRRLGRDRHRHRRLRRHGGAAGRQAIPRRRISSSPRIDETHACCYLLANDIDMEPVPGYAAASWSQGYGDFTLKPDHGDAAAHSLARGDRARARRRRRPSPSRRHPAFAARDAEARRSRGSPTLGMKAFFASELEFYLFDESYEAIHAKGYREPEDRRLLHRGLSRLPDQQGRAGHAGDPQRAARRGHSGREFQGRVGAGPGRDQRPLRRGARNGRPPCR